MLRLLPTLLLASFVGGFSAKAKEFKFAQSSQKVAEAVLAIGHIGELAPLKEERASLARKYPKPAGTRRIVYGGAPDRAGESCAFTYKGKRVSYRGTIVFDVKPAKRGSILNVFIDGYEVEAGRAFNLHTFNFQSANLVKVQSTGAEENYLARLVAIRLRCNVDAPPLPLVELKK